MIVVERLSKGLIMKRMLFNATQQEELRVALVDGQRLYDLDIETTIRETKKSNVYKGKITRVEPSLEAAFIDYGSERHGFLPLKEISRMYFKEKTDLSQRINIKDVIKEGQEIVVQVAKEERGNKGAALTTFISLAGRYSVLMPNNPRAGGVSRRIEGDERNEAREALSQLDIPDDMGLIIRTAGLGKNVEELQWDLNYLLNLWKSIDEASNNRAAPFLVYQESNLITRTIRDYFRNDISEIIIDEAAIFEQAREFMSQVMPHNLNKIKLYQDPVPLFTRYQIESQIESAFQREVRLPSGGSLVIDHTEALISIDINSARATKGGDIEETAFNTNLEAADEIARQLRLRDLGGVVVIDFIDMTPARNQREVENRIREALKMDRARVQVGRISRFGLLEMSRQRLRPSLGESVQLVCPRCTGQGTIRGVESTALSILRVIEEEAMKEKTARILAQVPVDVATFLLNEKRDSLSEIEKRQNIKVLLVPNTALETPHYDVERIRENEADNTISKNSYELATHMPDDIVEKSATRTQERIAAEEPAVKSVAPASPRPVAVAPAKPGLLVQLWRALFGTGEKKQTETSSKQPQRTSNQRTQRNQNQNRNKGGQRRGNQQRRNEAQGNRQQSQKPKRDDQQPAAKKELNEPNKATEISDNTSQPQTQSNNQTSSSEKAPSSRRGRRGGRRRRTGSSQGGQENSMEKQSNSTQAENQDGQQPVQTSAERPNQQAAERSSEAKPDAQQNTTTNVSSIEKTAVNKQPDSVTASSSQRNSPNAQNHSSEKQVTAAAQQAPSSSEKSQQPAAKKRDEATTQKSEVRSVTTQSPVVESRPVESRPAESRPAETKPAEKKPVETKPTEQKLVPQNKLKSVESKPANQPAATVEKSKSHLQQVQTKPTSKVNTSPASAENKETKRSGNLNSTKPEAAPVKPGEPSVAAKPTEQNNQKLKQVFTKSDGEESKPSSTTQSND